MAGTLLKERQISMLREEIEILMDERQSLLDAAGAAAVFVASLDSAKLPRSAHRAQIADTRSGVYENVIVQ